MGSTVIDRLLASGSAAAGAVFRAVGSIGPWGALSPLKSDRDGSLEVISKGADVFGRIPVSEPHALWSMKQTPNGQALADLISVTSLTGGGLATYLAAGGRSLSVPGAGAASSTLQSRQYVPYEPGRQNEVIVTGTLGAPVAGVTKRMGQFDSLDGTFFEVASSNSLNVRKGGVDTVALQAAWNKDTLDGSGPNATNPSGMTLDPTAMLVLVIQYGWLGGAGVRFGFVFDTEVVWVHWVPVSSLTGPFMDQPSLPVRWEISGTAAASMISNCGAVLSFGGFSGVESVQVSHIMETPTTVGTAWSPLLSVRLSATHVRGILSPKAFTVMTNASTLVFARVSLRGTLTGPSWVASSGPITEYDVTASAVSGARVISASDFLNATGSGADSGGAAGRSISSRLQASSDFSGVADVVTLEARVNTGTAPIYGSLTWEETSP